MAFVCTVTQGKFRVQGFKSGSAALAIIDIGYDDAEPLNYKAAVGFDTLPGGGLELYFHIVEADGATGGERVFWSGRDTRFIAGPTDRQLVLVAVLAGLRELLASADPAEFVWFTHDEAPPKKALVKFAAVRQAVDAREGAARVAIVARETLSRSAVTILLKQALREFQRGRCESGEPPSQASRPTAPPAPATVPTSGRTSSRGR